jgi:hypothetical protein
MYESSIKQVIILCYGCMPHSPILQLYGCKKQGSHDHKTFQYELRTRTSKSSNQNTVFIEYEISDLKV